ncbi:hypothetical protein BASA83_006561 [Batrachochytrium salamandrivorans]|nr:hypothetical protein BASA62_001094 [Batrachochytrium salamandrivorans]KAH9271239.1 hypothetical protein BASA83_006561 [Batrachochytrium salamandrivorans]
MGRRRTQQTALEQQPEPTDEQLIAKVLEVRGGGLYNVAVALPAALADTINTTDMSAKSSEKSGFASTATLTQGLSSDAAVVTAIDMASLGTPCVDFPCALQMLVLLPSKFQKLIWIKTGSFVIISITAHSKTKAKMVLPAVFDKGVCSALEDVSFRETDNIERDLKADHIPMVDDNDEYTGDQTDDDDLFVNNNHGCSDDEYSD